MRVVCTTLWLPKKGNTSEEYEDAACPTERVDEDKDVFRCAVADGATEASFARLWAKLLVDGYVDKVDRAESKKQWSGGITQKALPWYAEQKAESGAYAALVGLELRGGADGGTWIAEALGDCCLMIVRDGQPILKWPLTESEEFNSSPVLLSSNSNETEAEQAEETLTQTSGDWKAGDVFYLMSDALARWAYQRQEEHNDVHLFLKSMNDEAGLKALVDTQRALLDEDSRPRMRNDDVTYMRVEVS